MERQFSIKVSTDLRKINDHPSEPRWNNFHRASERSVHFDFSPGILEVQENSQFISNKFLISLEFNLYGQMVFITESNNLKIWIKFDSDCINCKPSTVRIQPFLYAEYIDFNSFDH